MRTWTCLLACLLPMTTAASARADAASVDRPVEVPLQALSPLATNEEVMRRTFPPTSLDRVAQVQAAGGDVPSGQAIDPVDETLELFVPPLPPGGRYGLLVYVMPGDSLRMPEDWPEVFAREGFIYVSALRSSNDASVQGRRLPLALHAVEHVRARYPVDPERVYVGGFSGGARMAQWLATAWPDVFRGAALTGGSLQVGEHTYGLPPRALALSFLRERRLVFATGSDDALNGGIDRRNRKVLQALCFQGYTHVPQLRTGHWLPSAAGIGRVLQALQQPVESSPAFDRCLATLDDDIAARLARVQALVEAGKMQDAGEALGDMEDRYGGLAEDRALPLARRIAAARPGGAE